MGGMRIIPGNWRIPPRRRNLSERCGLRLHFSAPEGMVQNRVISGRVCKEDERGSAANPHPAHPPAIAVPETLPLPDAVVIRDIGRAAIIAVTGPISIIARPISITGAGKRAFSRIQ